MVLPFLLARFSAFITVALRSFRHSSASANFSALCLNSAFRCLGVQHRCLLSLSVSCCLLSSFDNCSRAFCQGVLILLSLDMLGLCRLLGGTLTSMCKKQQFGFNCLAGVLAQKAATLKPGRVPILNAWDHGVDRAIFTGLDKNLFQRNGQRWQNGANTY